MLTRTKTNLRIAFALVAMLFVQTAFHTHALAHTENGGVSVFVVGVVPVEGSTVTVELHILVVNGTASAATLRGLYATGATRIVLERQRTVLGTAVWQRVNFLRLEPGEDILVAPPDYRILIQTENPSQFLNEEVEIQADFGPLGDVVIEGTR